MTTLIEKIEHKGEMLALIVRDDSETLASPSLRPAISPSSSPTCAIRAEK